MLRSIEELTGYAIRATDGPVGEVVDVYFDDATWVLRWFVVDTGSWLSGRKVLISPIGVGRPDVDGSTLPVAVTQDQVRASPDVDTECPVSRQHEKHHLAFYGYPDYWGGAGLWGDGLMPDLLRPAIDPVTMTRFERDALDDALPETGAETGADPHLRSYVEVVGYRVDGTDGEIGHVEGLLVDDATWAIRYLIVETGHWWSGHQVLIEPARAERIDWFTGTVVTGLTHRQIADAPAYDPALPVGGAAEDSLRAN